jgi:subtilisin family serine protease
MRTRAGIAALAAVVVWGLAPAMASAAANPAAGSEQSWIVVLDHTADPGARAAALAQPRGGRVDHVFSHVLSGFSFTGTAAAADAIARSEGVRRVVPDGTVHATELSPFGVTRISGWAAHEAGYTGLTATGQRVRIAVLDTGVKSTHTDLAANVFMGEGTNCITPLAPPEDDHGHGTHVAGTAAAAFNGSGVVGVATNVKITPVKVLNSTGVGTDSQVICGLDHVAALAEDGVPTVVNMSLADENRPGEVACSSSPLHEAVCALTAEGVTVVAAAGNDGVDATSFVPAAFPEVIAVSAFTDFDGGRSSAGCSFDLEYLYQCDDMLADFSNYGSVVDVTAPGVHIHSTLIDGTWGTESGTSMAAPHVAGAAALVLSADPALSPDQVRTLLETTGECPDGTQSGAATCVGKGQWMVGSFFGNHPDSDGIAEPLVNVLRAAQAAGPPPPPPTDTVPPVADLTAPAAGAAVRATVNITATANDNVGVDHVEFYDGPTLLGSDTTVPYSLPWNSFPVTPGPHTLTVTAFDAAGLSGSDSVNVNVDNIAPSATLTAPTAGTIVVGLTSLTASASDPAPASGVKKVTFLVDGAAVGNDANAPYGSTWDSTTVADGSHTLRVKVVDEAGNSTTSPRVTITVANASPVELHVQSLTGAGFAGAAQWKASATVSITDQNGFATQGATVTLTLSGGASGTVSCTTAANGTCTTVKVSVLSASPSVTFTVSNVIKTNATWDGVPAAVTINKPA